MDQLTFTNPVFAAYAVAAALMIAKMMGMSCLTVYRMMRVNGGFRSPEDTRRTFFNPHPSPTQLAPNDYVDRVRRIHLNNCENIPLFLAAGLLYVLTAPPAALAVALFYAYAGTRFAHFLAYITARTHETRAALWTPGALIILFMAGATLVHAASA